MTMMRELLFVLDVTMLRECDGDGSAGVENGGSVVAVSVGHEYVGGSCIVSIAADVCGMRGVGGVCEMCMCLARGGEGSEWIGVGL